MEKKPTILVVGASPEELGRIQTYLPEWECRPLTFYEEGPSLELAVMPVPSLLLVYAQKDPVRTKSQCRTLRDAFSLPEVPLLLAVGLWTRLAAGVAALLTVTFGVTMLVFLGPLAPFRYPVFVFTAAAILLAGLKRYRWSIDALRKEVPGAGRDNDAPGTR